MPPPIGNVMIDCPRFNLGLAKQIEICMCFLVTQTLFHQLSMLTLVYSWRTFHDYTYAQGRRCGPFAVEEAFLERETVLVVLLVIQLSATLLSRVIHRQDVVIGTKACEYILEGRGPWNVSDTLTILVSAYAQSAI
jgi:hypothetical protein